MKRFNLDTKLEIKGCFFSLIYYRTAMISDFHHMIILTKQIHDDDKKKFLYNNFV